MKKELTEYTIKLTEVELINILQACEKLNAGYKNTCPELETIMDKIIPEIKEILR